MAEDIIVGTVESSGQDITLYRYQQIPKNIVISTANEQYTFADGTVTHISLMFDYVNRRLPWIQMGMEMETEIIADIYANLSNLRLSMEIIENEINEEGTVVGTSQFLQHAFSIVPVYSINAYITATDTNTETNVDLMKKLQAFEMYLVDLDAVNMFNKQIDFAVNEHCTRGGLLKSLFEKRGIPKEMNPVATPPQLNGEIERAAVPVGTFIENIRYMNDTYGFYAGKPIVFYDFKYLYCISKQEPNLEIEDVEDFGTVCFILKNPTNPQINIHGSRNDAINETHWINLNKEPYIHDPRIQDTYAKFSTLAMVDGKGVVSKTTINDDATSMLYAYALNELSEAKLLNESMQGPTVSIMASEISVQPLRPYKDYVFDVDTTYTGLNLNGNIFRLLSYSISINRETRDSYISDVALTLYQPKRTDENSSGSVAGTE